jgi:hypothetical protein
LNSTKLSCLIGYRIGDAAIIQLTRISEWITEAFNFDHRGAVGRYRHIAR